MSRSYAPLLYYSTFERQLGPSAITGAGAAFGSGQGLGAFIDLRVGIHGELDVILPRVPLRAGVRWRF